MPDDNRQGEDKPTRDTRDTLRPEIQQGDTAQKREESEKRASEDSKDTLRPRQQRADRNK